MNVSINIEIRYNCKVKELTKGRYREWDLRCNWGQHATICLVVTRKGLTAWCLVLALVDGYAQPAPN